MVYRLIVYWLSGLPVNDLLADGLLANSLLAYGLPAVYCPFNLST